MQAVLMKDENVRFVAIGVLVIAFSSSEVSSQAFNCKYAKLPDELAICRDDSLKALDEQMAERFFRIRQELPEAGLKILTAAQKKFLENRGFCGSDGDCIDAVHVEHLELLCRIAADYEVACK